MMVLVGNKFATGSLKYGDVQIGSVESTLWSNFKNLQGGLETKSKWFPYPLVAENLVRNGVNRFGPFVTLFKLEFKRILD
jgi:hypothetical protein